MSNYLDVIKDKVVVIKEEKGKTIAITAAVCVGLALAAVAVHKICKASNAIVDDDFNDEDFEIDGDNE